MINNAILNIFSLLLLAILFMYSLNRLDKNSIQQRAYYAMLVCTMVLLVLDIFSRFDGNAGTIYSLFNRAGNFLIFLLNPVLPSIWLIYVDSQIFHDDKRTKRLVILLLFLIAANFIVVLLSQSNGWYYTIDANNIYHRGPLFILASTLPFSLLLVAFMEVILNKEKLSTKQLVPFIFFPVPPFVCIFLQLFIYGVSFALNGTVLSLMIVTLSIQNEDVYTDHLTGVGNRKKLEAVLKEKVAKSSRDRTFSLIMVDINNFKEINDTLGHDMGDKVLKAFAELLEKSVRSKDYVTRYGGDEFCLIMDISEKSCLDSAVLRINNDFGSLNHSGLLPFCPTISMGYAIYDHPTGMSAEAFFKQVDTLLYENKRRKQGLEH